MIHNATGLSNEEPEQRRTRKAVREAKYWLSDNPKVASRLRRQIQDYLKSAEGRNGPSLDDLVDILETNEH